MTRPSIRSSSGRSLRLLPLLALLGLVAMSPAGAQLSVGLFPPRVEGLTREGARFHDAIALTNEGDVPISVSVSIVDFDVAERGDVLEYPPATQSGSVAPHLRISPLSTVVPPNQRAHFRYVVTAPEDFNQLRAMVYFNAEPQLAPDSGQKIAFATSMGVPFYVENRRAEPGRLAVHEARWERIPQGDEFLLLLHLAVTNEGERNIRPSGYLQVRSPATGFARSYDFNDRRDAILPGHRRLWTHSFGPVPGDELFLKLRFAVSPRTSHRLEERLAAVAD